MACSNCYTGCSEITSDKCVKYTGIDVPILEIKKGDSLSYVTQALVTFLTSTLDGTGIKIVLEEEDYCELISQYLQECSTVTAFDLFKALVKAACNLQEQIDSINNTLSTLNADYDISCLDGVSASSDTHAVLQAVIAKLCELDTNLGALITDVDTNYVKLSELNELIQQYLDSTTGATRYSSRMVPYSIVPYYGTLGVFDATGAGLPNTEWENIYLCNGQNDTPDLRGRALVGAIAGVPGGALSPNVNPSSSAFNPNYALGTTCGVNSVTLTESQIPSHTHVATVNDPGHSHEIILSTFAGSIAGPDGYEYQIGADSTLETESSTTGITVSNAPAGGGEAHNNVQPVIATYFIMYIPS